jgi:hypothetical protein
MSRARKKRKEMNGNSLGVVLSPLGVVLSLPESEAQITGYGGAGHSVWRRVRTDCGFGIISGSARAYTGAQVQSLRSDWE